jgi:hypothetical protein
MDDYKEHFMYDFLNDAKELLKTTGLKYSIKDVIDLAKHLHIDYLRFDAEQKCQNCGEYLEDEDDDDIDMN